MRLPRFIGVLLLVMGIGGGVGAAAGALFGLGTPQEVHVGGVTKHSRNDASGGSSGEVEMAVQADRSPVFTGAAWGAGLGLLVGGAFGLLVALADQGALLLRRERG